MVTEAVFQPRLAVFSAQLDTTFLHIALYFAFCSAAVSFPNLRAVYLETT
jgi:hypothetical protein